MVGLNVLALVDHVVSVSCQVVLHIPLVPVAHLDVGTVGVWWLEVRNPHQVPLGLGVIDPQSLVHASARMLSSLVGMHSRSPAPAKGGFGGVHLVISFVVKWHCLIASFLFLHV